MMAPRWQRFPRWDVTLVVRLAGGHQPAASRLPSFVTPGTPLEANGGHAVVVSGAIILN